VEDPKYVPGSSVENDRQWALARAAMILRKEAAAGSKPAAKGEAQVSQPGEPAEKEADQVADKLHGGGGDAKEGAAASGGSAEQAKEGEDGGPKEGRWPDLDLAVMIRRTRATRRTIRIRNERTAVQIDRSARRGR
jgi:hypothetical protein